MARGLVQFTLIASTLGTSWLGMQIVHETGHVACAWLGGETVSRMVLHPLSLSRTDTTNDRHPLLICWGGPIFGILLPLCALGLAKSARSGVTYLFRFFAGFCLIANGAYLGVGGFYGVGDAGDLLRYGAPHWILIAFGLVCVPVGLGLWNGLGPQFGLRRSDVEISRPTSLGMLGLFLTVVIVELLV